MMLVLLLVAIMGPWTYTLDGVPPPEWCHAPLFLLGNGHCAGLVSGATIITFWNGAFFNINVGLVTGVTAFPERAREFLGINLFMMLLFLLILPFFTTLLLTWRRDSKRLRIFHLTAWGLAAILSWLLVASQPILRSGRFWGIWLYIGVTASALTLEVFALVSGRNPKISNRAA